MIIARKELNAKYVHVEVSIPVVVIRLRSFDVVALYSEFSDPKGKLKETDRRARLFESLIKIAKIRDSMVAIGDFNVHY